MSATIIDLTARLAAIAPDEPTAPARYKTDAPCCVARRDSLGRLPIGYCGPGCVRRRWMPVVDETAMVAVSLAGPLIPWGECT